MNIDKNSIIKLADGKAYIMLNAQKIGDRNFCVLIEPIVDDKPIMSHVGELRINDQGTAQVRIYAGPDIQEIKSQLLKF